MLAVDSAIDCQKQLHVNSLRTRFGIELTDATRALWLITQVAVHLIRRGLRDSDRRSYAPDPDDRSPYWQPPADCCPWTPDLARCRRRTQVRIRRHAGRQRGGCVRRVPGARLDSAVSTGALPDRTPGARHARASGSPANAERCSRPCIGLDRTRPQAERRRVTPSACWSNRCGQPRVTSPDRWRSRTESGSPQHRFSLPPHSHQRACASTAPDLATAGETARRFRTLPADSPASSDATHGADRPQTAPPARRRCPARASDSRTSEATTSRWSSRLAK